MITAFHGEYAFLSNFYPSAVTHDDVTYPSVEHAFQAAKTRDKAQRLHIASLRTPADARRAGRRVSLRQDWETVKVSIMKDLVTQKFKHLGLRDKLLATGDAQLIEGNTWGDRFWGVCNGSGQNHLGKILMQVRSEVQKPTMLLIDGGLIHKGFHSFPGPYNGLQGLVQIALNALAFTKPALACVAWDCKRTWRHEQYAEYKANRKEMPPELLAQIKPAQSAIESLGMHNIALQSYEADDIIGTLSERAKARGCKIFIVSGDTDLCQLLEDNVRMDFVRKGFAVNNVVTAKRWQTEKGFPASLISDFKALAGDPSDNIPGVAGVGKKTALALIQQYGDLENILANAWQIKGRIGRRLHENKEQVRLWHRLTTICRNAPIPNQSLRWQLDLNAACSCLTEYDISDNRIRKSLDA